MGNEADIKKCVFTGREVKPIIDSKDAVEYSVEIDGARFSISLTHDFYQKLKERDGDFERYLNAFHTLLKYDKLSKDKKIDKGKLDRIIQER